jgi:hypothetical protein
MNTDPLNHNRQGGHEWDAHEHVATPVQLQAQRLLEQAGSPELAKHAVDSAASQGSPHDGFARQLGYASYLSLFEDSALCAAEPGKQWFATAIGNDAWILWNDADLAVVGTFASREGAEAAVSPTARIQPR